MKWFVRSTAILVALLLMAASYLGYRTVWGTPFRFNDLLNRQAIVDALDSPQTMTQAGVIDGAWYDMSSSKLDPYSLADRQERIDRTRRFDAEIAAWSRDELSP